MQCKTCGSTNVMRDAWAAWDVERQRWELGSIFDAAYCGKCQGATTIVEEKLKEVAPPTANRLVATAATMGLCYCCGRAFNAGQIMVVVAHTKDPEMPAVYHEHCLTQGHSAAAGKVTYTSHATWPTGVGISLGNIQNESTDTHGDKAAAEAVCQLLHERGFGGDGQVFPLMTWVTSDEGEPISTDQP
jgi:hypothetical protein